MNDCITSLRLFALSLAVCSVAYPAIVLAFACVVAPESRQGSMVRDEQGRIVGSRLLAQKFTRPEYFWPRPSAVDYDAGAAGGSNLPPSHPALAERAREILSRLQPHRTGLTPADLVTASGSGLDPHITLASALLQAHRVARARNLPLESVESLAGQQIDSPALAVLGGEPLVNVLELNLALDARAALRE